MVIYIVCFVDRIKQAWVLSVIGTASMTCLLGVAVPGYGQTVMPRYQKQVDHASWRLVSRSARRELEKANNQISERLDTQRDEAYGALFVRTLDAAGAMLDSRAIQALRPYEATDPLAKLAVIAWDRRTRPNFYAQLDKKFVFTPRNNVAGSAPLPLPAECKEEYRLYWEFLFLCPLRPGTSASYVGSTEAALCAIASPATMGTLKMMYEPLTVSRNPQEVAGLQQSQSSMMRTIVGCATNQQAAETALDLMHKSEVQQQAVPLDKQHKDFTIYPPKPWDVYADAGIYLVVGQGGNGGVRPLANFQALKANAKDTVNRAALAKLLDARRVCQEKEDERFRLNGTP